MFVARFRWGWNGREACSARACREALPRIMTGAFLISQIDTHIGGVACLLDCGSLIAFLEIESHTSSGLHGLLLGWCKSKYGFTG